MEESLYWLSASNKVDVENVPDGFGHPRRITVFGKLVSEKPRVAFRVNRAGGLTPQHHSFGFPLPPDADGCEHSTNHQCGCCYRKPNA